MLLRAILREVFRVYIFYHLFGKRRVLGDCVVLRVASQIPPLVTVGWHSTTGYPVVLVEVHSAGVEWVSMFA